MPRPIRSTTYLLLGLFCLGLHAQTAARHSLFAIDNKGSTVSDLPFYLDLSPNIGRATVSGPNLSTSIPMNYLGLGATVGVGQTVFFGATLEYGQYQPTGSVDGSDGNLASTRWFLAPELLWRGAGLVIKAEAQYQGDLKLRRASDRGTQITYTDPLGGRLGVLMDLSSGFHFGLNYTQLFFHRRTESGQADAGEDLRLAQWGVVLAALF